MSIGKANSKIFGALRNLKNKNIADIAVGERFIYFVLQDNKGGSTGWRLGRNEKKAEQFTPAELNIRSNHNCYGAAAVCAALGNANGGIFALDKNVLYYVNDKSEMKKVPIEDEQCTYGNPVCGEEFLYIVKEKNCDPLLLYGNLAVSKSQTLFYNAWKNGMPFDEAKIYGYYPSDPQKKDENSSEFAKLNPQPFGDGYFFIDDSTKFTTINSNNVKSEVNGSNFKYKNDEKDGDIGDPCWIVGNQRPIVTTQNYLVFTVNDKLRILHVPTETSSSVNIENIDLLTADYFETDVIYFKAADSRNINLYKLDLTKNPKTPELLYGIDLIQNAFEPISPKHIKEDVNGIQVAGYLYEASNSSEMHPTIIWCHGGPTMRTNNTLDFRKQSYLSAGFHIFDLEYTGTWGYGREYRTKLYGHWGDYDAKDVLAAITMLKNTSHVNTDKFFVMGSSAGAYLALCAIADDEQNLICAASVSASFYNPTDLVEKSCRYEKP
uniref:Peptidase S9 prolyl oligopeptidase catalytic domain-containing protein n=1 Tax=Panagrolaimus superbus TaxID=310955 RepID=A0A914YE64_9BILA